MIVKEDGGDALQMVLGLYAPRDATERGSEGETEHDS